MFLLALRATKTLKPSSWLGSCPFNTLGRSAILLRPSLDKSVEPEAETEWDKVIARRSREMAAGRVDTRSEEELVQNGRIQPGEHLPQAGAERKVLPRGRSVAELRIYH
jgi:hypothetical protein